MLRHADGEIENHWNSLRFIKILKSWTHLEFKYALNPLGFSTKMLRHTDGEIQNHWNSVRFIKILGGHPITPPLFFRDFFEKGGGDWSDILWLRT